MFAGQTVEQMKAGRDGGAREEEMEGGCGVRGCKPEPRSCSCTHTCPPCTGWEAQVARPQRAVEAGTGKGPGPGGSRVMAGARAWWRRGMA